MGTFWNLDIKYIKKKKGACIFIHQNLCEK